jgi:hypothetical protein
MWSPRTAIDWCKFRSDANRTAGLTFHRNKQAVLAAVASLKKQTISSSNETVIGDCYFILRAAKNSRGLKFHQEKNNRMNENSPDGHVIGEKKMRQKCQTVRTLPMESA